jgi:hypothetical protein
MADIGKFTIRGFEEQFEPETVDTIRYLLERITKLNLPCSVRRFYASELSLCLSAGALLGALHVASSLLEIVVREIFIELCTKELSDKERKTKNPQRELEEKREFGFNRLVQKLKEVGIFKPDDAQSACDFYNTVRIPVHHGLPVRFVEKNTTLLKEQEQICRIFGIEHCNISVGFHDFEKAIEKCSLSLIETSVGLIERIAK